MVVSEDGALIDNTFVQLTAFVTASLAVSTTAIFHDATTWGLAKVSSRIDRAFHLRCMLAIGQGFGNNLVAMHVGKRIK